MWYGQLQLIFFLPTILSQFICHGSQLARLGGISHICLLVTLIIKLMNSGHLRLIIVTHATGRTASRRIICTCTVLMGTVVVVVGSL